MERSNPMLGIIFGRYKRWSIHLWSATA